MNAINVKTFLWENGLTISQIAETLEPLYKTANKDSLRVMLTRMFYHGDFNPTLASLVNQEFGLYIPKPNKPQTVKEAVRQAA